MKNESSHNIVQKLISHLAHFFAGLRERFSPPKRQPELWELEARFTKNDETDPERLQSRQFSNSVRSGRG